MISIKPEGAVDRPVSEGANDVTDPSAVTLDVTEQDTSQMSEEEATRAKNLHKRK